MEDRRAAGWKQLIRERASAAGETIAGDVLDELALHIEDLYQSALAAGASEAEARDTVIAAIERSSYGEVLQNRRATAPMSPRLSERTAGTPARLLSDIRFDLRYAWRSMFRQPALGGAVIAILAVGIGATTAAFAVLNTVLFASLPYSNPQELVVLKHVAPAGETRALAAADWLDYAAKHDRELAFAAYASWPMNVTGGGDPERLRSVIVSGGFFDLVGMPAALGRTTTASDDTPSATAVAVLSDGFWRRRFGGDRSAVGRSIVLNGRTATIVGVMPPAFAIPSAAVDLWTPMGLPSQVLSDRASEWLWIVGRLRPGVRLRDAQSALAVTAAALARAYPKTNANERVVVRPLLTEMVGGVSRALWLGGVAALFVLLAGCANAANLTIARATLHRDEIAIRSALGAEPLRIARQLLVETSVLAACGGACGLAAAQVFIRAFAALADGRVPRVDHLHLDGASIMAALAASLGSVAIVGGATAWMLVRQAARTGMRDEPQRVTGSTRLGSALLAGQVAFALILLAGALAVTRNYASTLRIDPGFDVSDTLTMQVTLPRGRYPDNAAHVRFAERAVAELSGIPGVTSAGVVSDLPFVANALHFAVRTVQAPADGAEQMTVRPADEGFFRTLMIPAIDGRLFTAADRQGAPLVAVVNRTAASRLGLSGADRRIVIAGEEPRTLVGIVGDIKHGGLREDEGAVIYVPYAQKTFAFLNWMGIVLRGPAVVGNTASVKAAMARVDPSQPLASIRSMSEYLEAEAAPFRFSALVVGSLAAAAFVLAITGIYALTASVVGRRTRELGVRLALGASEASVVWLVLRQMLIVFFAGTALGLGGAAVMNRMLRLVLAEPAGADALVTAAGGALLLIAALAAALVPAVRAARIDPKAALQAE